MDYRYKAFISYRHSPHDKSVAERLQKKLESYKPPKGMDAGGKWRIFRDETELSSHANLSDGIKNALRDSEYLIVICSEDYKQSRWCMEEIEHFKNLHNGSTDMIIPLVVSGRPEEVFPDILLTSAVRNEQTGEYEQQPVEPLAANVSSKTTAGSLKLLNTEILRIAAPMLNCSYDSLFLRERRRKRKRNTAIFAAVFTAVVVFTLYTLTMLMKISSQNADLEDKNKALDLSNSNLTVAYRKLDTTNAQLEDKNTLLNKANDDLKQKQDELTESNTKLEETNKQLQKSNDALDTANSELTEINKALDAVNSELTDTNKALDTANSELTSTNKALDSANKELTEKKDALQSANNELTQKRDQLSAANAELAKMNTELENEKNALDAANKELTEKRKELEKTNADLLQKEEELRKERDNLDAANKELTQKREELEKANADLRQKEEELRTERDNLDAANKELTEKRDELSSANKELTEKRDELAAANNELTEKREELEQKNEELGQKNEELGQKNEELEQMNHEMMVQDAAIRASAADSTFTYQYDRNAAIEELLSAALYQGESAELLPSAVRFLNKALYTYTITEYPLMTNTLKTQSIIKDFAFSPSSDYIVACDRSDFFYVFDIDTGKVICQRNVPYLRGARMTDDDHLTYADNTHIYRINIRTGETEWTKVITTISRKQSNEIQKIAFSDDCSRLALWDDSGYYAFIDACTGELLFGAKNGNAKGFFYSDKRREDYSDGVHFSVAYTSFSGDVSNDYITLADVGRQKVYSAIVQNSTGVSALGCVGSTGVAAVVLVPKSGYNVDENTSYSEFRLYGYRNNSMPLMAVPLYNGYLSEAHVLGFFNADGTEYIAVTGYELYDHRYSAYFINAETGDVYVHHTASAIRQIDYFTGTNVVISTEDGEQFFCNFIIDSYDPFNYAYHSNSVKADGSSQMIWLSDKTAAAVGRVPSNIVLYQPDTNNEHTNLPCYLNNDTVIKTLLSDDYIVVIANYHFILYDAKTYAYLYMDALDAASEDMYYSQIFGDYLAYINTDSDKMILHRLGDFSEPEIIIPLDNVISYSMQVSDDGRTLTAVTQNKVYRVGEDFAVTSQSFSRRVEYENYIFDQAMVSPDGKMVLAQTYDIYASNYRFHLMLLNEDGTERTLTTAATEFFNISFTKSAQNRVVFSADSSMVAVATEMLVTVYDTADGSILKEIPIEGGYVLSLAFEPDSSKILVLSEDTVLNEFDLSSGQLLRSLIVPIQMLDYELSHTYLTYLFSMDFNPATNDLILYHRSYGCIIDLDYLEISADLEGEHIEIFDLDERNEQIVLFNRYDQDVCLVPLHHNDELLQKALNLIARS